MTARAKLFACVIAALVPALILLRWLSATSAPPTLTVPPTLPKQLGAWSLTQEARLESDVLVQIEPDYYLFRRYEAEGRSPIWLYMGVYAARSAYGKGAHDPEVCYPAQGWEIMATSSLNVPVSGEASMAVKFLETHNGSRREDVLYWFQPAERWPQVAAAEELRRIVDAIAGRPQYAFVRISGPSDGSPATTEDLTEFASEVAPIVRAVVDGIGSGA